MSFIYKERLKCLLQKKEVEINKVKRSCVSQITLLIDLQIILVDENATILRYNYRILLIKHVKYSYRWQRQQLFKFILFKFLCSSKKEEANYTLLSHLACTFSMYITLQNK